MNYTNITEVCNIQLGKTPKRSESKYWGQGYSWVSIADMNSKFIANSKEEINDLAVKENNMKIVPENTLIMSFKLSIGKVGITKKELYTNEAIAAFIIKDHNLLLTEYLYYVLKNYNYDHLMDSSARGKTLNKQKLEQIEIPLISIKEQEQIIHVLNKAENLLRFRQQQIEALSALKQSIFLDMFGNPVSNNRKWKRIKGKNLIEIIGGFAFKSKDYSDDTGIPLIRIGNVNSGVFKTDNFKFIPEDVDKYKKFIVYPGDLLLSLTGTVGKDDYGNICVATDEYDLYLLNQRVAKIEPSKEINESFLLYLFKNPIFKKQLTKLSRGVRQANISNRDIYNLDIILPPMELQNEFHSISTKMDRLLTKIELSLKKNQKLYDSLLHRAFNGELFKENIKV